MKTLLTSICILLYSFAIAQPTSIYVGSVTNKVKIGPMTGNKNLAFGVRNIAEEAILDKGHDLNNDSTAVKLDLEIIYFDIQQTATGVSVFHKTENETIYLPCSNTCPSTSPQTLSSRLDHHHLVLAL
jgi:hypothetical protein